MMNLNPQYADERPETNIINNAVISKIIPKDEC